MGNSVSFSNLTQWASWTRPNPKKLLMLGLDAAGKTTLLYSLKLGEPVPTIPTIGFNVEEFKTQSNIFVAWDVGGRSRIRTVQRHYYKDTDGIVFVVDSNDRERMDQARDELHQLFEEEELRGVPFLIMCNKQDLPNAMSPKEILLQLLVPNDQDDLKRPLRAMGCVAKTGQGLEDGLIWFSEVVKIVQDDVSVEANPQGKAESNKPTSSSVQHLVEQLGYDPSDAKRNPVLKSFRPIQLGTECPFAKAAKLWGVTSEKMAVNAEVLSAFVQQSQKGDALDGFCVQLPPEASLVSHPKQFGTYVYDALRLLSDLDPSGERVMQVNYIGARGWRFRFAKEDFFVTTFAPCYPSTSSRYAFGTGKAFVLLQPERSFHRHKLPDDTPLTMDPPQTIRDKTRLAFREAGRSYSIPATTKYPPAEHIVKPIVDDGVVIIRWWERESNSETKEAG